MYSKEPVLQFQSTHSRGVRPDPQVIRGVSECFNPRTHEECDKPRPDLDRGSKFQSTHSRGVRHPVPSLSRHYPRSFNPRTHEECDLKFLSRSDQCIRVSIHALTRSATQIDSCHFLHVFCFNPRTHEECDLMG